MMLLTVAVMAVQAAGLPAWEFEGDLGGWVANSHLENVRIENLLAVC